MSSFATWAPLKQQQPSRSHASHSHFAPPPAATSPLAFPMHSSSHNEVQMNRDSLVKVLDYMSTHVQFHFPSRVKLVVHGGASFLLDRALSSLIAYDTTSWPTPRRTSTRDVDYINRSFASEWKGKGMYDATERLKSCIKATAGKFGLGSDWMNSDADVALPVAYDMGQEFDPISSACKDVENPDVIYTSPNGALMLISVTRWWAISMKLMRFQKQDPQDIYVLFKSLSQRPDCQMWDATFVETKLSHRCWPMISRLSTMTLAMIDQRVRQITSMMHASRSTPSPSSIPPSSSFAARPYAYPSPMYSTSPHHFHSSNSNPTPVPGSGSALTAQPRTGGCSDPACKGCLAAKPGLTWATWTDDPDFLEKIRQGRADTIRIKRGTSTPSITTPAPSRTSSSMRMGGPPPTLPVAFAGYS